MNFDAVIDAARLQDVRLQGVLTDASDDPLPLTGATLALGDVSQALQGRITVEVTDAAAGEFEIFIDGSSNGGLPVRRHHFRIIRAVTGGDQDATYLVGVKVA